VPRPRNIRAKDTSRVEARRRYRAEQRADGSVPEASVAADAAVTAPQPRPALALPNVGADLAALPRILLSRWMWIPFAMLLVAFVLVLMLDSGALPAGSAQDMAGLYISLTLPPTSLFVFFIGGFLAPRAAYLVGALLGIIDALLYTLLFLIVPDAFSDAQLQEAGLASAQTAGEPLTIDTLLPLWGIAILVGILAASFAAWYRRFLRSSQERARANRALREQEQARKAKEQARADKAAARKAR
jgi:hypothetical protein